MIWLYVNSTTRTAPSIVRKRGREKNIEHKSVRTISFSSKNEKPFFKREKNVNSIQRLTFS